MNLLHIESRSSDRIPNRYEFFVECAAGGDIHKVIEILKDTMTYCSVVSRNNINDSKGKKGKHGRAIFFSHDIRKFSATSYSSSNGCSILYFVNVSTINPRIFDFDYLGVLEIHTGTGRVYRNRCNLS